jgi:L-ascorbate metabolism protein UlaG (beta-lactamase superfamily)
VRELTRRKFLAISGATAATAALAAACGDDGDDAAPDTTNTTPAVTAGTDASAAGIRWYGQSMFLLTSPGGATALLDPFGNIGYTLPPPLDTDIATITHEHPDHNNGELAGARTRLLRGLTAEGYADIDEIIGDLRIKTVRAFHDAQQGATFGRNALFVFETAGLRLAHLGDLGHQLDDAQVAALGGAVDVLMVPVGGAFTIDAAGATELVAALQPKIVFPMHYKTARTSVPIAAVDPFLEGKTVERASSTTTRLSRDTLPAETTVMVLDYE